MSSAEVSDAEVSGAEVSSAEVSHAARAIPATTAPAARRVGPLLVNDLRFLGSELRLVLTRRRNLVMLGVLALAPVIIGVAIELTTDEVAAGEGPPFFAGITRNGLFLAFTALTAALPVFLPIATAVVAGESVAGEASLGTLRYLLVTPVSRTRVLVVKYLAIVAYGLVATLVVAGVGILVGAVLFPVGDVQLLSGSTISYPEGLLRALLVALYVAACVATVGAIGLFVSTLTEVPVAAMSATAITVVVLQILDAIPQLAVLDDWIPSHHWFAFGDLLRDPVATGGIALGLAVQAGWVVVMGSLAWARLATKDVTS